MRVIVDLQACQYDSSMRGIGRYSLSLAHALIRNIKNHELILYFNEYNLDKCVNLIDEFSDCIGENNIKFFKGIYPSNFSEPENRYRTRISESIKHAEFSSLKPDFVHTSSLFDGFNDQTITSINTNAPYFQSVTFYDLIPYLDQNTYLPDKNLSQMYFQKLTQALRSDLIFTISDFTRKSLISEFNLSNDNIINISSDASPIFQKINIQTIEIKQILDKYHISQPFLLFAAAVEPRKNLINLIYAYEKLTKTLSSEYKLVIVGRIHKPYYEQLLQIINSFNLKSEIIFCNYVTDDDLIKLYNLCDCFVFPSLEEGFGLPVLEAMRCGAPMVCSNVSSIPEVINFPQVLFDPNDAEDICNKLINVLSKNDLRTKLLMHCKQQSKKFSWDKTAKTLLDSMSDYCEKYNRRSLINLNSIKKELYLAFVLPNELNPSVLFPILSRLSKKYEITLFSQTKSKLLPYLSEFTHEDINKHAEKCHYFDRLVYGIPDWHKFNDNFINLLTLTPGIVFIFDDSTNQCEDSQAFNISDQTKFGLLHPILEKEIFNRTRLDLSLEEIKYWLKLNHIEFIEHSVYRNRTFPDLAKDNPHYLSIDYLFDAIENKWNASPAYKNHIKINSNSVFFQNLELTNSDLKQLSDRMSLNAYSDTDKRLLVDITILNKGDAGTGVQRVVKNILFSLQNSHINYKVSPIFREGNEYYYAIKFMCKNHSTFIFKNSLDQPKVDINRGDIYLGLDMDLEAYKSTILRMWASKGVKIYYILYDLLPHLYYELFPDHIPWLYKNWIQHVSNVADGVVCISKAVADEYNNFLNSGIAKTRKKLSVGFFYLGSEISQGHKALTSSHDTDYGIDFNLPSFLTVATIEPRKGYDTLLKAFNSLWQNGQRINLIIVGKPGWKTDNLQSLIKNHKKLNENLFWFNAAEDLMLSNLYHRSTALIAASRAEGFGLPIVEAANYNLPVIARNIPVFKEIGKNNIFYFKNDDNLASCIIDWLELRSKNSTPNISNIQLVSWEESAQQLLDVIINNNWYDRSG